MGFFDTLGHLFNVVNEKAEIFLAEIEKHSEYYRRKSDTYLMKELKRLSYMNNAQKIALKKVLNERGYGVENDD